MSSPNKRNKSKRNNKKKGNSKNKRNSQYGNARIVKMNQTSVEVFINAFGMELPEIVDDCLADLFRNFHTYCPYENGYALRSISTPGAETIGVVLFEMPECGNGKKALKRALTTLQWSQTEVCRSVLQDHPVKRLMFFPDIKPIGDTKGKTYYGMFFVEPDNDLVEIFKINKQLMG